MCARDAREVDESTRDSARARPGCTRGVYFTAAAGPLKPLNRLRKHDWHNPCVAMGEQYAVDPKEDVMRAATATFAGFLPAAAAPRATRHLRNVLLFVAAPFIGLAYAVAFPVVGLGALAWMAYRAARERNAG